MFDIKFLDDIAKQLSDAVPESLRGLQKETQKTFHSILQSSFNKLDLVTREEFDTQVAVLARTRKKVDALEKQIAELEKLHGKAKPRAKTKAKPKAKKHHDE